MKKLILAVLLLLSFGLTAQVHQVEAETIGRSIQTSPENMRLVTIGVPIVMIVKEGEKVTQEDLNRLHPYDISDGSVPIVPNILSNQNLDSTMLNMIKCMMQTGNIECEDIGCGDLVEKIEAGVWRTMFAGGIFKGLYTYWIQGQVEPLLNYHNGVIRFNGHTVQIYQLIGNDKPVPIGQDLRFYY